MDGVTMDDEYRSTRHKFGVARPLIKMKSRFSHSQIWPEYLVYHPYAVRMEFEAIYNIPTSASRISYNIPLPPLI